jgi:hypothetical protein
MSTVEGQGIEGWAVLVSGRWVDPRWRRQAVWRCALCTSLSAVLDTRTTRKRV